MSKVRAVLDQIEAEQRQSTVCEAIPDNVPLPELAEQVVRGKGKLSSPQLRMLIELLPFHLPRLSAVAVGRLTGEDFLFCFSIGSCRRGEQPREANRRSSY